MAFLRKIKAGLVKFDFNNFIGEEGTIFYDVELGTLRISDGSTPGGIPISLGSNSGATIFRQLNDTPNSFVDQAGKILKVNTGETALEFVDAPVTFNGNYNDLTNLPDLSIYQLASNAFSGNYDDLTNKPTLFSGNYSDLNGKPTLFSGDYNDLSNKPDLSQYLTSIGSFSISDLSNVSNAAPSNGQVLKWNGSEWAPATDLTATGGSGISLTDLSVSVSGTPSGNGNLAYDNSTGIFTFTPANVPTSLTQLGITDGTNGQVLTTDGSGNFSFSTVSGGGGSSSLAVKTIDASNNVTKSVTSVNDIRFDTESGFDITDLGSGAVKIQMNSTFKTWKIEGQSDLIATGLDTIELVAGAGIAITTNPSASPHKTLTITNTGSGAGDSSSGSSVGGLLGVIIDLSIDFDGDLLLHHVETFNSNNALINDNGEFLLTDGGYFQAGYVNDGYSS